MATLSINQMRVYLCSLYSGAPTWQKKVGKMSDNQVYATYHRIMSVKKEN